MKKVACTVGMLLFFCTLTNAQIRNLKSLIGEWEAIDKTNASGGLIVMDSAKLYLVYGTDKREIIDCKIDFSKSPYWFDFTVKDSSSSFKLKSLLQFINDDLVQWQVFEGDVRPDHFANDKGDIIYMKRKQLNQVMVKTN